MQYSNDSSCFYTVKTVYYEYLGISLKYTDYQGVLVFQVSLHVKGYHNKCPHYKGVPIFRALISRFHCRQLTFYHAGVSAVLDCSNNMNTNLCIRVKSPREPLQKLYVQ